MAHDTDNERGGRSAEDRQLPATRQLPEGPGRVALPAEYLAELDRSVEEYSDGAWADNTHRVYQSLWQQFVAWCRECGFLAMPAEPDTVARYLAYRSAQVKPGTLEMDLQAIRHAHETRGRTSPTTHPGVKRVMSGIRRKKGTRQEQAAAIRLPELHAAVCAIDRGTLKGLRDVALLLTGYAGALRRSEISAIDVEHLTFHREGVALFLPRSKTDQEGAGVVVPLHRTQRPELCPMRALTDWMDRTQITGGAVFRSLDRHGNLRGRLRDGSINDIVKERVRPFAADPDRISGHSLRAGFITEAAARGVPEHRIQGQSRHKSRDMLQRYIREAGLFRSESLGRVMDLDQGD